MAVNFNGSDHLGPRSGQKDLVGPIKLVNGEKLNV
jgi:hypothetical protein